MRTKIIIGVAAVAVMAAAAAFYLKTPETKTMAPAVAMAPLPAPPLTTPLGITMQRLGETKQPRSQVIPLGPRSGRKHGYADARGMTFYTYDKDVAGMPSACTGECATAWPPAVAPANAKPLGVWSLAALEGGGMQWVRNGKRLYTSAKDMKPGHTEGEGGDAGLWHTAAVDPDDEIVLPKGMVGAIEVADANGHGLVDSNFMTLYAFAGNATRDEPTCAAPPCASPWIPLVAPQLANPVGDFTVVARKDGNKQWAYKGHGLYKFDGDIQAGDANGIGVDKRWNVAVIASYFQPPEISTRPNVAHGLLLTDANGMTLYRREAYTYEPGGHSMYRSIQSRPQVGREIGTGTCDANCLVTWHPLKAPADAQPSGYWEIAVRSDGTRQWAYQGYPLYTYAGDKKPGDATGVDIYDMVVSDDPNKVALLPTYQIGAGALFWTFTAP